MLHINSNDETVAASPEKVFQVLTQFMHQDFSQVPGLTNFEPLENGCKFSEQVPCSRVVYKAETDKPISAEVTFDIEPAGEGSVLKGHADIQVPFFLQGMVKGAIDKFMGTAMQYLKTAIENS